ncbi:TonB-dependent receptor [Duganella sp. FT80W]|uniref:TonB-dependent receptor n=1 Tax=Duganella guangzhouensis TaxID=2666084 RepID=A0A6I2LAM7_9BURK|nr:TonB-dependent receptor [Duganella guangzhouensis]MRW93884.1 TonB-dependent receptor [Duganella guangzhouensis]
MHKEKQSVLSVRLALSLLAGATMFSTAAQAQSGGDAAAGEPQKVIITGSNIARIAGEGATPVEIITRAEIDKSGASTVVEMLSKLPSVSVSLDGNSYNSFAGGASSVGLRGLDSKYTLILLNGRRLANYGFANGAENSFVDLNNIPLAALESVEILRDGASAIYGSDAVAGVINFKTRTNYQGMELSGNLGSNVKGDGSTFNASLTKGWGDLDKDGYNVLMTVDALKRNSLRSSEHSALANPDYTRYGGSDNRTTDQFQGWVRDYDNGEGGYAIPGCVGKVGISSTGDQVCFTNPDTQLTPRIERVGVSTIVTKRLDGGDELFAELGFNHNKSTYQQGYPVFSSSFLAPTDGTTNPGVLGLPGETEDTWGFAPGDRLQVFHAITEAGPKVQTIKSDTARVVTGWRGTIHGWDSEFAVNLNRSKLVDETTNTILLDVSNALLGQGILGTGGYDPFNPSNPMSVVSPMLHVFHHEAVSKLGTLDWKMSTPSLFNFQDRPVGFAWGAQASHESINDVADPLAEAGNIVNYGATSSTASRSLYSVYGELAVPLLAKLDAQVALRGDHYSDFGTTWNPKLALAWRAADQILLRGSATTSFKAPTLPELGSVTTAYTTVADWARCVPLGYVGAQCSYSPKDYLKGNPNLKPEKAANYSLGIVLQPVKDLSMSLDWYGIHQRDTIQALDAQYIVDNEDIIPGFAALVGRDPRNPALEAAHPGLNKGRINSVTTPFSNVGKTIISGADLDISYALKLGAYGKLSFHEAMNRTFKYDQSIAPGEQPTSRLDGVYHPRWNNSLRTTYDYGDHSLALTARTASSTLNISDPTYSQDADVTNARVPSYTVWDLNYTLKASKQLVLNFGVNNVFDKAMVYSNSAYVDTYVQGLNDVVGRYAYVNARYSF